MAVGAGRRSPLLECVQFVCMECGHEFQTVSDAERAAFGDEGCPDCGGSDIDVAPVNPLMVLDKVRGD